MDINEYVPMEKWGRDHWSTLAYMETVIVEHTVFTVKLDPRMRQTRRMHRVLSEYSPPKDFDRSVPMDRDDGTVLADGSIIKGHDDWACVQDIANLGLLNVGPEDVDVGVDLTFSDAGMKLAAELRAHKANGGSFKNFKPVEYITKPVEVGSGGTSESEVVVGGGDSSGPVGQGE